MSEQNASQIPQSINEPNKHPERSRRKRSRRELLKTHFGFDSFRPNQEEIIESVLAGEHTLAIMPTGGGKSLCFQLPALALEGTAIVISPLIALMKDQVDALNANGIMASYYNSSQPSEAQEEVLNNLMIGQLQLLYVAPESLWNLTNYFQKTEISLIAVDEAHCISAWGHDFRPAYTQLSRLQDEFPQTPIIALTATADRATQDDIMKQLRIENGKRFVSSFDRPNLYMEVRPGQQRIQQVLQFLKDKENQSGIIYCLSRKSTEKVAEKLVAKGYKAKAYHAGIEAEERSRIQEDFVNDRIPIIVATIAFGMGIDKSNVRWVIHYNMPKNIEGYYQEIGRSGRDGLPAHGLMFYSFADVVQLRKFATGTATEAFQLAKLERMQQFAEALSCRRKALLNYFGEHVIQDCGNCDICKMPPKYFDGTVIAQKICSAVARLQEQEAMGMVIDVLRGSQNAQIFEKGYQNIKTFAAAKEIPWKDLQQYVIQLLNQGVLEVWFHEKGRLVLTPTAKQILFEGKKVRLADLTQPEAVALTKEKTPKKRKDLFEKLRTLRTKLAQEAGVPAYVVFSDASLEDMEQKTPKTVAEFAEISGVGRAKLEKYADVFLQVIAKHQDAMESKVATHERSLQLFEKGFSVTEISNKRGISENTVYGHFLKMKELGHTIDLSQFITSEEISAVQKAKQALKDAEGLRPYFDYFEEQMPYWKIKFGLFLDD
ncbi:DNA helicase RecQ [Marinirhabdus gelatinilytica]|uniref:DNA helicase RecQ n=1 Tax=Marinirhabdus gelatinilytica TaxID=1703343 RepID=A0A370QJ53_9FLAO|nr:DNA helicase RecQ [Marinirhabdus gelatinilytica]RDK88375.1 ATP-dependent DNA helicase RecQ [Marinirhabdus gelatinilytica]